MMILQEVSRMNLPSVVVALILAVIVIADIRYLRRSGKGCSGSCSSCGGACKWTEDVRKAKKAIKKEKKLGNI